MKTYLHCKKTYKYSPAPGRIKVAAGGHLFYRCCLIRSMSTVIIRLYILLQIFILRVNLLLVFSLLPLLFCVPRLVSRSSSCHLISIVISFPCPFHLHLHLIVGALKSPNAAGRVCEPHEECKTSKFRRGPMGTWMAWANEDPSKLLRKRACNFWIVMGCGQPKNLHAVFQRESHQDFCIQHMNGWRWLLISLSAQLAQSETAVNLLSTPIFCLYFGVLPGFYWFYSILPGGDGEFSFHSAPVRCNWIVFARQMHSTTEFAMTVLSKCVTHAGFVKVAWTLRGIPF